MKNFQTSNLLTGKITVFSISLIWQLFFIGKEKLRKTYSLQTFGTAWQNLAASSFFSLFTFSIWDLLLSTRRNNRRNRSKRKGPGWHALTACQLWFPNELPCCSVSH